MFEFGFVMIVVGIVFVLFCMLDTIFWRIEVSEVGGFVFEVVILFSNILVFWVGWVNCLLVVVM